MGAATSDVIEGTMSDDSHGSGVLSLSCSLSSVESDLSEHGSDHCDQETIEPYRFEPEESDTPLIHTINLEIEDSAEGKMTMTTLKVKRD